MGRRILLATNETPAMASAAAPSLEGDGFQMNHTTPTLNPPVSSIGNFNPTLAVVLFTMIFCFFLVGFAMGHCRRWILDPEHAADSEDIGRRRRTNQSRKPPENGLDPELVRALPLVQYADLLQEGKYSEDCPVCLAVFEATDSLRLLPQCAHAFHSECIDKWFKSHTTCPLCRACLANSEGEGARTEDHDVDGDAEQGDIGRSTDFDIVQVVTGGESSGTAAAMSGFSQDVENTESEHQHQQEEVPQVNARPFKDAASFIRAIRIGTSAAAKAAIRRSSSVGSGLQLRQYVVDSEGTQHNSHAIAVDHDQANELSTIDLRLVSLRDLPSLAFGVRPNDKVAADRLQHVWSTRWSFPNLRQIAPP